MLARLTVQRLLLILLNTKCIKIFANSTPTPGKAIGHIYTAGAPSYAGPSQIYVRLALTIFAGSIIVLKSLLAIPINDNKRSREHKCHPGAEAFSLPCYQAVTGEENIHKKHVPTTEAAATTW